MPIILNNRKFIIFFVIIYIFFFLENLIFHFPYLSLYFFLIQEFSASSKEYSLRWEIRAYARYLQPRYIK